MLRGGRESVCISRMETPFAQPRLCDEHWHLLPKFSCVILKPSLREVISQLASQTEALQVSHQPEVTDSQAGDSKFPQRSTPEWRFSPFFGKRLSLSDVVCESWFTVFIHILSAIDRTM